MVNSKCLQEQEQNKDTGAHIAVHGAIPLLNGIISHEIENCFIL